MYLYVSNQSVYTGSEVIGNFPMEFVPWFPARFSLHDRVISLKTILHRLSSAAFHKLCLTFLISFLPFIPNTQMTSDIDKALAHSVQISKPINLKIKKKLKVTSNFKLIYSLSSLYFYLCFTVWP